MAKTRTVRACAGPASARNSSAELSQRVDPRRKLEVVLGQAALGVRRQSQVDLVPRDRDVRVVVHLLRGRRDAVQEVDRSGEVAELELPRDRVALTLPFRQVVQSPFDL